MLRITVASLLHMHKSTKMCMLSLMPETGRWATDTIGQKPPFGPAPESGHSYPILDPEKLPTSVRYIGVVILTAQMPID